MFKDYFSYRKQNFIISLAALLIFCIFSFAGGAKPLLVIIAAILFIALFAIITLNDYKSFVAKHQALTKAVKNIKKLPEGKNLLENDYLAIIENVNKSAEVAKSKAERERDALYVYFSGWFDTNSEIKKTGDPMLIDLSYTTLRSYMLALSGGFSKEEVSVDETVRECAMKYNAHFMNKKIGIGIKKIGLNAYCDKNALKYIIEELLVDCLNRTERGGVKLYSDKSGSNALIIEDSSETPHTSEELFAIRNTGIHTVLAVCRANGILCESASKAGRTAFRLEFPTE